MYTSSNTLDVNRTNYIRDFNQRTSHPYLNGSSSVLQSGVGTAVVNTTAIPPISQVASYSSGMRRSPSEGVIRTTPTHSEVVVRRSGYVPSSENTDALRAIGGSRSSSQRYIRVPPQITAPSNTPIIHSARSYVQPSSVTNRVSPTVPLQGDFGRLPQTGLRGSTHISNLADPMRVSRISHESETVQRHEPRLISFNRLPAVEKGVSQLEPVLIGINTRETTYESDAVNLKKLLIECYKRIVLLGMENDRLVTKNTEYEMVFGELKARINTYEVQLEEIHRYQTEHSMLKSRSDSLEARINEILAERNSFLMEIEHLQENLRRFQSIEVELNSWKDKHNHLSQERISLSNQLNDYSTLKSKLTMLAAENERLSGLIGENRSLSDKLVMISTENERLINQVRELGDLKTRITMLAGENERLSLERGNLNNQITMLATENERLSSQVKETSLMSSQITMLAAENERLSNQLRELTDLRNQNNQHMAEKEMLNRQLNDLKTKITMLASENERLQSLRTENQELQRRVASLTGDQSQLQSLRTENVDLRNRISQLTSEHTVLSNQSRELQDLKTKITMLASENERLQSLRAENQELQRRIASLTGDQHQLQSLRTENVDLRNKINQLNAELNILNSSRSELQDLKTKITMLASENERLQSLRTENQDLHVRLNQLSQELSSLQSLGSKENTTLRDKLTMLAAENERLIATRTDLISEHDRNLQALINQRDDLIRRLEESDRRIRELTLQLERSNKDDEINHLKRSNANLSSDREDSNRRLVNLQNELSAMSFKMKQFEVELGNEKRTKDLLQSKLDNSTQEFNTGIRSRESEIERLKRELLNQTSNAKMDNILRDKELELQNLRHDLQESEKLRNQIVGEIRELDKTLFERDREIEELSRAIERHEYNSKQVNHTQGLDELNVQLQVLRDDNNDLRRTIQRLENDAKKKDQELSMIFNTKSEFETKTKGLETNSANFRQSILDLTNSANTYKNQLDQEARNNQK